MKNYSRKYYKEVATILNKYIVKYNKEKDSKKLSSIKELTDDFIDLFKIDNDRFNRSKFEEVVYKDKEKS